MNGKEEQLVYLITERDVSSIQILGERLKLPEDEVVSLIEKLLESGELRGNLTADHNRFFKSDVKPTPARQTEKQEEIPDFLEFDPRPGRYTALLGFAIVVVGIVLLFSAGGSIEQENVGTAIMLVGVIVLLSGCYYLGRRKTP
ncbi:hypothetical protein EU538_09420 [Candidatus Thorarchaeota archaeon]|nr:MAG: hypothetical protein EU538_09420 [Candidatus Thorarchaeota archaeon]